MKRIGKHYNKLVKKFHKIEAETTENEIHDKRVILRRVFPILRFYKINPSKVKYGELAFELFGKLRDVQVQILKLEKMEHPQEWIEYLQHLKELELKYIKKVTRFSKKKVVEFPSLKSNKVNTSKIDKKVHSKVENNLNKLIAKTQIPTLEKAEDIHKIRIAFKKFRYTVEVLSYIEEIDADKLEKLKTYQDELGEIQDCEVLINGITRFYREKALIIDEKTTVFEVEKDQRIEHFRNEKENFIEVCKDIINQNHITLTDDYEQERH
ncbi:MAG: CHAD domain-containing protein [Paludibacter sp.]